jgi:beta-barrel assembly-enhancing protease
MKRFAQLALLVCVLVIACTSFYGQSSSSNRSIVLDSYGALSNSEEKSLQKFIHSKHRGKAHGLNLYSRRAEREMGERAEVEIDRVVRRLRNEKVAQYLGSIGRKLAMQPSSRDSELRFKVLETDEVNAMSLPNGVIYVNSGLISMTENEAELAGVLAHEIAHISARHASRAASRRELWGFAAFGVAIATGGIGSALQPAFGLVDGGFSMKFSRDSEREADLLALTYLDAAGYDPKAYVSFLRRLNAMGAVHGTIAKMAATHPATQERVRRAQRAIEVMLTPKETYVENSSDFEWTRRTVLEFTHPGVLDYGHPVLKTRPRQIETGNAAPTD